MKYFKSKKLFIHASYQTVIYQSALNILNAQLKVFYGVKSEPLG